MVKIKICGLRRLEDIEIVNKYEPEYIGFVFADSKRKVSHETAAQLKNNLSSAWSDKSFSNTAARKVLFSRYPIVKYLS